MPSSTGVWTDNWSGVKNYMLCNFVRDGWSTIYGADGQLITVYEGALPLNDFTNGNTASGTSPALIFGTGNTALSSDQVALATKWTSNISRVTVTNGTISYDENTHTASRTIRATIQNTGSLAVTIREWGISGRGRRGANNYPEVLLYRALLDEPVTLAQYESATLTVTISMQLTDPI